MEPEKITPIPTKRSKLWLFVENILYVGCAVLLAIIIQAFVVRPFIVSGNSMDPIIKDKQYLIIDEITYKLHEPARGDVIVFRAPPEPSKYYIKRIIGLPGDTVKIKGQTITISNKEHPEGFALSESFITHTSVDDIEITVPENNYYVMGDNRSGSYDSRSWGLLPYSDIRGRALLRLLPLNQISYLPGKVNYESK